MSSDFKRQLIILGLGGNLGDREVNLKTALGLIEGRLLDITAISSLYHNPAMLPENAPPEWDIDFLNMAICRYLKRDTSPQSFLAEVKKIELSLGRKPSQRWAPRPIDIDILAWGDLCINEESLQIPHIGLHERDFAYRPVIEIYPEWVHPLFRKKLIDIIS